MQIFVSCVEVHVHLLAFASKTAQLKSLNYIPTSCSSAKFLFLVTFLNLVGDIPFKNRVSISYVHCVTKAENSGGDVKGEEVGREK